MNKKMVGALLEPNYKDIIDKIKEKTKESEADLLRRLIDSEYQYRILGKDSTKKIEKILIEFENKIKNNILQSEKNSEVLLHTLQNFIEILNSIDIKKDDSFNNFYKLFNLIIRILIHGFNISDHKLQSFSSDLIQEKIG